MYETTDLQQVMQHKRLLSPGEAYRRATASQRAHWFPAGAPAGASAGPTDLGSGASWDPDPAGLERAKQAGLAAAFAGYGEVLPDSSLAPCATCPACQFGRPQDCRRPLSKAEARLHAGQALDADRRRASATLAELEMLVVELGAQLD